MNELFKEITKIRDREVDYQKKCKCEDEHNSNLFFYLEGRISALSDVILQYYYHFERNEGK